MSLRLCLPAAAALAAMCAVAQPTTAPATNAACAAEIAAIETEMDVARDKGQMLRRRQLAEKRTALQAGCGPTEQSRASEIDTLQQHIRQLRTELDEAEAQLRRLQAQP